MDRHGNGTIRDIGSATNRSTGSCVDESPPTPTRRQKEDVVEIQCHGRRVPVRQDWNCSLMWPSRRIYEARLYEQRRYRPYSTGGNHWYWAKRGLSLAVSQLGGTISSFGCENAYRHDCSLKWLIDYHRGGYRYNETEVREQIEPIWKLWMVSTARIQACYSRRYYDGLL